MQRDPAGFVKFGLANVRSCPSSLRLNIRGLPDDRHRGKKVETRSPSWHPNRPLTPGDTLEVNRVDAPRQLRSPPLAASHHPACSPPHWLGPWRHTEQEHLP